MVNFDFFKKKPKAQETTVVEEFDENASERGSVFTQEDFYDKYTVPSDFNQVISVVKLEFKHFLKTKSFFVLFILGMIVPLIQMSGTIDIVSNFAKFMGVFIGPAGDISANTYMHYCMCLMPLIMLLCMVFFCGKTISNEYAERTAFLNIPLPMERWVIFTGKFIAISLISISILLFSYGMSFLATSLKYDSIILGAVFGSLICSIVSMMALVATGMLFSALIRKRGGLAAFGLMFLLIPVVIPIAFMILESMFKMDLSYEFLKFTLPFIVDGSFLLISWDPVVSIPSFFIMLDFKSMIGLPLMLIMAIIWGAACFAGGLYLFNKKEV